MAFPADRLISINLKPEIWFTPTFIRTEDNPFFNTHYASNVTATYYNGICNEVIENASLYMIYGYEEKNSICLYKRGWKTAKLYPNFISAVRAAEKFYENDRKEFSGG